MERAPPVIIPDGRSVDDAVGEFDQLPDRHLGLERVTEVDLGIDVIPVAATDPFVGDAPRRLEVGEDAGDGAGRDADGVGDVALAHLGVLADRDEHMGVVGQERPRRPIVVGFGIR